MDFQLITLMRHYSTSEFTRLWNVNHTCGYVLETCKLRCGVVLQRDELKVHEKEKCPQRIVECKHCSREMKSCELAIHLDNVS